MKSHKRWSIGAMLCMCMACISGFKMKSKEAHKYWALGACGCMAMSIYTVHKMVHKSNKKSSDNNSVKKLTDDNSVEISKSKIK